MRLSNASLLLFILLLHFLMFMFFFLQAEDGIRDVHVTGVQTCALPISGAARMYASSATTAGNRPLTSSGARGPCTASTATSGRGTTCTSPPSSAPAEARTASATFGQLAALGTSR